MRTTLRQDPDIILIGEIRDELTAETATTAANTGHLVLSSVHTNNAIKSLLRFISLGVGRDQIEASLRAVLAQRLVRTLDHTYCEPYDIAEDLNKLLRLEGEEKISEPIMTFRPLSTTDSNGHVIEDIRAHSGRTIIPELWIVGAEERQLIYDGNTSEDAYLKLALRKGMQPLWYQGIKLALKGETTLDEIRKKVASPEEFVRFSSIIMSKIIRPHLEKQKQGPKTP